jgi:branched-chain amino acid transport system ATP-binding protein
VRYRGADLAGWGCERRVAEGIVLCPEGRRLFQGLTVRENLLMGGYTSRDAARAGAALERVFALFPRIAERRGQLAGTLSGGEQQMVAISRALMAEPRLLLLDEPSLGLAPNLVQQIFDMIAEIRRQGTTVVLVEQNASMALAIADHGYVMETGTITLSGPARSLLEDRDIIETYLG